MDVDLLNSLKIDPDTLKFIKEVLIALAIGLLVGLEREYSKTKEDEDRILFAGIRTYPIVALIAYISIYLGLQFSIGIYLITFAFFFAFVVLSYYLDSDGQKRGATTEFSLIAIFLLSSYLIDGQYLITAFLALILTAMLALKVKIHEAVLKLDRNDILSILLFIVISCLILPLLPNEDLGPYEVLNPFKIWLIVTIFISLNFTAYFLHKFSGKRSSLIATGIFGGFASSTATTWYFSKLAGKSKEGGLTHTAAIILASSIMFPRLLIWLAILNQQLFNALWLPVLLFGIMGLGLGIYLSKQSMGQTEIDNPKITNPINLREAGIFAILYILILLLVGFAEAQLGNQGVYYAAGISGITGVDAIAVSMSNYAQGTIAIPIAAVALLIAAFTNTLLKYVLCMIFGNDNMRKYSSYAFIPLFLLGIGYISYLIIYTI
jgi:uncharacterized membrane protein (DUF4010 family)